MVEYPQRVVCPAVGLGPEAAQLFPRDILLSGLNSEANRMLVHCDLPSSQPRFVCARRRTFFTFSKCLCGNFRGEIKQFLQRLIKAVELVLAQLIGRFKPKFLTDQRERAQRMPKLRAA